MVRCEVCCLHSGESGLGMLSVEIRWHTFRLILLERMCSNAEFWNGDLVLSISAPEKYSYG